VNLARRSVTSATWNVVASVANLFVAACRLILLSRLLPVETFGTYGFATSAITLTVEVANFGMMGAFLHRARETQDEEEAAAAHFTLKAILTLLWATFMVGGALLLTTGPRRTALLVLTATTGLVQLVQTPKLILMRRVVHRRLALLQVTTTTAAAITAIFLAWSGWTLWALLATDIVALILNIVIIYLWRPVWRPRLIWSPAVFRYYFSFGGRNFVAQILLKALNEIDDLWTGLYLGDAALGFYSRAYTSSTYPRQVLAVPINQVAAGTYAELKGKRKRLSQAFFRSNALLVRTGFLLGGLFVLAAPEFIRIVLSDKWMPMLNTFRLMLIFTLLDPIKQTVADLFVAVGKPEQVVKVRFVQLGILAAGLFALGFPLGIEGVALAMDAMLAVGVGLLLWYARAHVDFSARQLFFAPAVALTLAMLAGLPVSSVEAIAGNDWATGAAKALVFGSIYILVLLLLEREKLLDMLAVIWRASPLSRWGPWQGRSPEKPPAQSHPEVEAQKDTQDASLPASGGSA
jgi:O-antigen/teichoic acid export membrane protein